MNKLLTLLFALIAMASTAFAQDYLCFEVEAGTEISLETENELSSTGLFYSLDNGRKWTAMPVSGFPVEKNCKVYFRGNWGDTSKGEIKKSSYGDITFKVSKTFKCAGNIMYLLNEEGKITYIPCDYCFRNLFADCPMTTAPKLPSESLSKGCYMRMFAGCTELTVAPNLPATHLEDECYKFMFLGCVNLATASELPAKGMKKNCYDGMYQKCKSLAIAPSLPALKLADECYQYMFWGCTGLSAAPELQATTLAKYCYANMFERCSEMTDFPNLPALEMAEGCYGGMFAGCKKMTTAPELPATTLADYCYDGMFENCTNLTVAPNLPATTLAKYCYVDMFSGCTGLITTPKLSATTLAVGCYTRMFCGCTGLNSAPDLPATTLAVSCYWGMFSYCTGLITAPKLPATTLAPGCYQAMFSKCASLVAAPELPATTMEEDCYYAMFSNCTNLNSAPKLPATTLATRCYLGMFAGCLNLTEAPELPATTLAVRCYENMFFGCEKLRYIAVEFKSWQGNGFQSWVGCVSQTGTFVCPDNLEIKYGDSYIPKGWTVKQDNPMVFTISCADANITADKTTATIEDKVNITIKDRTSEGYKLDKVLVNSTEIAVQNYKASFEMKDYLKDVTIKAVYSTSGYSITTDSYSLTDKTSANFGDKVNITFTKRAGYTLASATYNGNALSISDYKSSFTMPAANVEIKTVYTPTGNSEVNYLCFEVKAGTKVSFNNYGNANPNIQYSFDKKTWSDFSELTVENDCSLYFKGVNPNGFSTSYYDYSSFDVSEEFKCSGNVMSLIDGVGETTVIPSSYCFARLFMSCPLTSAPELPATTLASSCYSSMFSGCTGLTSAPELPATTLAYDCYSGMFHGCTSLTSAPELPATTLAQYCYSGMFYGCASLTTAPELPATTLASSCYSSMFYGCTSLTTATKLPATRLAESCYLSMFFGCTSLTTAPELPATTLAAQCYREMFSGCTSLTTAPKLPATRLAESCYLLMFFGCTSLTTAPELPATTLAAQCCREMFSGCTSLTTAPELPATRLADRCYQEMFSGCTGLTTAPKLPATTLAESCYSSMFSSCTSLTSATELPATTLAASCYSGMFGNCTSLTTAPQLPATTLTEKCYSHMFYYCTGLTVAPELPATTLAEKCYSNMFYYCTGLTVAPKLPATTLAASCYSYMFYGSTITIVPELPATTLAAQCYEKMFGYCHQLTSITVAFNTWPTNGFEEWFQGVNNEGFFFCPSDLPQQFGDNYIPKRWIVNPQNKNFIISSQSEFVTVDKTSAKYNDIVNFSIADRTSEGYKLVKVLVNDKVFAVSNYAGSFDMMYYLSDVTISAQYSKIPYTITTDEYSQVANSTATVDDAITVTFKQREGFDLTSATYNGNPLNIKDYKATFTMPAQDVAIKAVYTEKVYEIEKPSEGVSVSQPSAKAGDEITISVNPKDGYTVHLYVNGAEVALSGNSAVYIMPSGKIEITVKYVVEEKTPVSEIELDNCAVSVFPNPAKSGEEITLKVGGKFDMNNAKIYLYNASGLLVMQIDNVKEYNQLTLRSGVYVGVLVTKGGKKTFRVAVK